VPHRVGHGRSSDLQHAQGRTLERNTQWLAKPLAQSGFRCIAIKTHFAAEKALRRKTAEDNVRVGNRRFGSAPAVTCRPWFGAGAARADVQSAAFVEPSDAAAAGSHLDDVEDRDADGKPFIVAADKIIGRETRLAAPNDTRLGRRSAHVESDGGFEIEDLAKRHGADDATRGSRFHHLHALATRQVDVRQAAVGLHDQQVAGEFLAPQAPFQITKVLTRLRTDVSIGGHGRSAFVFAVFARQLMGGTNEQVGIGFAQDLAHTDFMLGHAVRMKKQHSHRFKAFFFYDAGNLARLLLVKRRAHRAVGQHPFGDLENILPRHQRPVLTEARVKRFRPIDPADLVNVAKSFGGNKGSFGTPALNNRVHHDGRAVDQGQNLIERHCRLGQALLNTSRQLRRRRMRLRERYRTLCFVENHNVRERTPDIDRNSQFFAPPINVTTLAPVPTVPKVPVVPKIQASGQSDANDLCFLQRLERLERYELLENAGIHACVKCICGSQDTRPATCSKRRRWRELQSVARPRCHDFRPMPPRGDRRRPDEDRRKSYRGS
jgi:hypothetical protein